MYNKMPMQVYKHCLKESTNENKINIQKRNVFKNQKDFFAGQM